MLAQCPVPPSEPHSGSLPRLLPRAPPLETGPNPSTSTHITGLERWPNLAAGAGATPHVHTEWGGQDQSSLARKILDRTLKSLKFQIRSRSSRLL